MPTHSDTTDERIALYRIFSSLFMNGPGDDTLLEIKGMFCMQFQEPFPEIREDFLRITQGNDIHTLPYESLHHYPEGESPALWGKAAKDVESFYSSTGLMIDEGAEMIPDHLSAELLFMSYLIGNNMLEEQKLFMETHLHAWVPSYCDILSETASTDFYREVADLLREFIDSEYEIVEG